MSPSNLKRVSEREREGERGGGGRRERGREGGSEGVGEEREEFNPISFTYIVR